MGAKQNQEIIEGYYKALAAGDFEKLASLHSDDVVFNMLGSTPVSGRHVGKKAAFEDVVASRVLGPLEPGKFQFAKKWRIMAADDHCVVAIMQGGGPAKNGVQYDQTYCQVFTMDKGMIVELHEFYDTVLVEAALCDNHLHTKRSQPANPFEF